MNTSNKVYCMWLFTNTNSVLCTLKDHTILCETKMYLLTYLLP